MSKRTSNWIRKDKRFAIYMRDNFQCVYCGRHAAELSNPLTLDHVTPVELGGENTTRNLVTSCIHCNSSKQDLPLADFLQVLADRGIDAETVRRTIRNATRRQIDRAAAKAMLANR